MKLPSFHDDLVVGYEVDLELRTLTMRIKQANGRTITSVNFSGVEGHCFSNVAHGNILLSVDYVSASDLIRQNRAEIEASFHQSGSPGPWAENLKQAAARFDEMGVHGYLLSASFGMQGWVLAKEVTCAAQQVVATDI